MKILQKPFTVNHKSAMFFHGKIARGKRESDGKTYDLETVQQGEISYKDKVYLDAETVELATLDEPVFDADIDEEMIVQIYVDKFFAVTCNGKMVEDDLLLFNSYDETVREFEIFLKLI